MQTFFYDRYNAHKVEVGFVGRVYGFFSPAGPRGNELVSVDGEVVDRAIIGGRWVKLGIRTKPAYRQHAGRMVTLFSR